MVYWEKIGTIQHLPKISRPMIFSGLSLRRSRASASQHQMLHFLSSARIPNPCSSRIIGVRGCRHRIYRSADSEVAEQELFPRPSAHVDTEAVLRRTGAVHHLHGQRLDERWSVSIQPKERPWFRRYWRIPGLDPHDPGNYRPISNLSYVSKLLERCVNDQLHSYLSKNNLIPAVQSAYRKQHSTETAVLKVLSDIYSAADVWTDLRSWVCWI